MARNGSGSYSLPEDAFVFDTVISHTDVNSNFSDIATEITNSIDKDGQTPISGILQHSVTVGQTANTGSVQGNNPITTEFYEIATCANAGDSCTLPSSVAGQLVIIVNNGANSADVFPASGDKIDGGSANAAFALAAGANALFICQDGTDWDSLGGGFFTPSSTTTMTNKTLTAPVLNDPTFDVSVGVTAATGSSQGDGAITATFVEISVCANAGDAVTLPTAAAGKLVIIANNGANSCDVFPASGDKIDGASANAALALAAGGNRIHICQDGTDWDTIGAASLGADVVSGANIADDAVDTEHLADDACDSQHYTDASIDTAHIGLNQIDETLMKDAFVGDFTDATVTASDYFLHGDATASGNTKKDTVQGILDLVPATSTTDIENDISLLALQTAINGNLSAYGLKNSWIEQFENSTYIENLSTVDRTASEYMASYYVNNVYPAAASDMGIANFGSGGSGEIGAWTWSGSTVTLANSANEKGGTTDGASTPLVAPANTEFEFHFTLMASSAYGPYCAIVPSSYSGDNDCSTTSAVIATTGAMSLLGGTSAVDGLRYNASGSYAQINTTNYLGTVCKFVRNSDMNLVFYSAGVEVHESSATHTGAYEFCMSTQGGHSSSLIDLQARIATSATRSSATGSFNSTDVTPSDGAAKTSIGLVLLYKDAGSSSCVLSTDVIAKVRANTGQAYDSGSNTLALVGINGSTTPPVTYSDGMKVAIAPAITVTSGTDLSYEISFANQTADTKQAHIYAVAMTY